MMSLGIEIKKGRIEQRLQQQELAKRAGISPEVSLRDRAGASGPSFQHCAADCPCPWDQLGRARAPGHDTTTPEAPAAPQSACAGGLRGFYGQKQATDAA